jgi:UDP-N-acetylglucosamine acyltransferase
LGSHTVLANNATLAGHVHVGDWAIVGGLSGIHQFVHVGAHAFLGFQSHVSQDVPTFMMASGNPLAAHGFNAEGLKRRGFSRERVAQVKQMHRLLYREGLTLDKAREGLTALLGTTADGDADVHALLAFLAASTRGIVR